MTVKKIGLSTLTSVDNTVKVVRKLLAAKAAATTAMAEEAKHQALEVYGSDGDGTWAPNASSTVEWKGHNKVMLGRTGSLSDGIEMRRADNPLYMAVGWFGEDHPDSGLTNSALAWEQEIDRPWLSKVHDNDQRAASVYAAGRSAYSAVL